MKLSNIFKKEVIKVAKAETQVLDKKQLEKVVGGTDEMTDPSLTTDTTSTDVLKTKHEIAKNSVGNIR